MKITDMSTEEFASYTERYKARTAALRFGSEREQAMAFKWRALSLLALVVATCALWVCGALTVKSLVLAVAGSFALKKYGDWRRNTWAMDRIKEIQEKWPT